MNCTRCSGTGFLNLEQVDEDIDLFEPAAVLDWLYSRGQRIEASGCCTCFQGHPPCSWCMLQHDVQVCDCCGDGTDWYGEPGVHDLNDKDAPFPECY